MTDTPPENAAADMHAHVGPRTTLIAITTTLLVLGALKLSAVITFPLLFAFFLLSFIWPVQYRLEQHMPGVAAAVITLTCSLAVIVLVGGALVYSAVLITEKLPEYADRIGSLYESLNQFAHGLGMSPFSEITDVAGVAERLAAFAAGLLTSFLTTGGFLALVVVYLVLGLLEAPRFRGRFRRGFGAGRAALIRDITGKISNRLHRFILVRTITSAATGLLTALACWLVGLDLAFVWGVIAFILNYIPNIGSTIAVIPPTLMALVQFATVTGTLGILVTLSVIQMVIGNYIDPIMQSRLISISPLAAFFSLLFWGWIGGVPGAVLGVPLTIGLIIIAEEFPATRWLAHLLADIEAHEPEPAESREPVSPV
jgi:predicted PurR-regulated permease PerM